ncbi:phage major tail tube protein [Burkholderia sp. Ac-20345]|uniref:phage major tail tube protein n=1 Tax=Burkholderia sp. Ac-20345 TaxID=2703891 RepID=UPI00197B9822|nr:phage major tail tube protein [Burkholderia sp. Ac-20345]MBN3779920.1 phage major tail tube protein [Burkholderia sp. Ac-20345]
MTSILINRITNANLYLGGNSQLGKADEISLPDITVKETEHKAVGMVGTIMLPAGFDKLEGKVKWNSFYSDVWLKFANPFTSLSLQCRSSVDTYTSQGRTQQVPLVTFLTVTMKKIPTGSFKQNDNAEFQSEFTASYIKQQLNGQDIVELDFMSNIFKVGGKDQLALYRANIGA